MDNKRNFLELKDKYFETARKRIEDLEKIADAEKLQWGLYRKELLELEEFYLKWEPNGSNLSNYLEEFEPFQKKLIDMRIKSRKKKGDSSWGKPYSFRNKKDKSKGETKQSQEEELQECQEKVIKLNEKEVSELSFEDYLTIKDLKQKVAGLLVGKNEAEEPFFDLRVKELKNSLENLEKDYWNLSKQEVIASRQNDSTSNNSREKKQIQSQQQQLQSQITNLENKPNKTKEEQALLEEKKKELEEMLKKQNSPTGNKDNSEKIVLYIGCGVVGLFALLLVFILTKNRKRNKGKY